MKLRIEKAIYGGDGLARIPADAAGSASAGKTVFVPYALPGELVEAHIADERRSFATAELDAVLEPSAERVRPGCEYFPACGGCQYQHASALYQPRMKLEILEDTLERAHITSHLPPIGSLEAEAWGYRNRIRLQVDVSGGFALCYRGRGSHSNLPVTHCPIAAPLIERAIAAVLEIGPESSLAKVCDEVEFFVNGEQDALLVSLWSGQAAFPANSLREFCQRLASQVPEFTGAGVFSSGERGGRLLGHWGQRSLLYPVAEHRYQVSLGSFFQVNRFLIPGLLDLVMADGRGGHRRGGTAWDLYAGAGLFSRALDFEDVTAVEASPFSAADLEHNLAGTPHRAVRSGTLDFIRAERRRNFSRGKPDFILLDPPRAGLGKEVCAELAQIAAPEVVYVSCDPATLARDLQALLRSGYCVRTMHMVDLFPQTFHLETVTALTRG
jgi:23S rRNA (uracil1939-C5)-methyltransferase